MKRHLIMKAGAVGAAAAVLTSAAMPATAAEGYDEYYDAGVACAFPLGVTYGDGGPSKFKELTDGHGNVVGWLWGGRGNALTYTNVDTGATFSSRANGFNWKSAVHEDGSSTLRMMGHSVLIMFPTDVPAGPSTTLYTGQVVSHWAADGTTTVVKESGLQLDICAELGG